MLNREELISRVILSGLLPKLNHRELEKKMIRHPMAGIPSLEIFEDKGTIFSQAYYIQREGKLRRLAEE